MEAILKMSEEFLTSFEVLGKNYELPFTNIGNKTKEHILIEATVLFALKGYSSVTMKDIADKVGITAPALYNHFPNKEALWNATLDEAAELFWLYHDEVSKQLETATSFREALDISLTESLKMKNLFTCFGFSVIMNEQIRDERAGLLFHDMLVKGSINYLAKWYETFIERGLASPFDAKLVANLVTSQILITLKLKVQSILTPGKASLDEDIPTRLRDLILELAK
jgi:AcrR family transcriptional regulator